MSGLDILRVSTYIMVVSIVIKALWDASVLNKAGNWFKKTFMGYSGTALFNNQIEQAIKTEEEKSKSSIASVRYATKEDMSTEYLKVSMELINPERERSENYFNRLKSEFQKAEKRILVVEYFDINMSHSYHNVKMNTVGMSEELDPAFNGLMDQYRKYYDFLINLVQEKQLQYERIVQFPSLNSLNNGTSGLSQQEQTSTFWHSAINTQQKLHFRSTLRENGKIFFDFKSITSNSFAIIDDNKIISELYSSSNNEKFIGEIFLNSFVNGHPFLKKRLEDFQKFKKKAIKLDLKFVDEAFEREAVLKEKEKDEIASA